jgi:hypothetical protein
METAFSRHWDFQATGSNSPAWIIPPQTGTTRAFTIPQLSLVSVTPTELPEATTAKSQDHG